MKSYHCPFCNKILFNYMPIKREGEQWIFFKPFIKHRFENSEKSPYDFVKAECPRCGLLSKVKIKDITRYPLTYPKQREKVEKMTRAELCKINGLPEGSFGSDNGDNF